MTDYEVLRVFCGPDGGYGNELGVVRAGAALPDRADRQAFARELGFSETVFVDDPERGEIDIYTPTLRLPFAGHPCVGAAWLLGVDRLVTAAGEVEVRRDGGLTLVAARPAWAPPRTLRRYASAAEVDALEVPPPGSGSTPGPGRTRRPAASGRGPSRAGATGSTRTRRPARRPCC